MLKKISLKDLEKEILSIDYVRVGLKSVCCCLIMKSGFEICGYSSPLRHENFDEEIGKQMSYNDAFNKLLDMEAYSILKSESKNDFENKSFTYEDVQNEEECSCEECCCEEEFDYRRCDCFECEEDSCHIADCSEGCPHIECPQNEEHDFQGYEDDGSEIGYDIEEDSDGDEYILDNKGLIFLELKQREISLKDEELISLINKIDKIYNKK